MCLFQVKVFFANGSVLRSTPMSQANAADFSVAFVKQAADGEVVEIYSAPIEKDAAQAQFRSDAHEWHELARRGRETAQFDAEKDRLALVFYNNMMAVGCSG